MEHVIERTKSLPKANDLHKHWGGLLLVDDDGSFMIVSVDKDCPAFGRSSEYLEGLAPSWSEAHPDNALVVERKPVQLNLF